MSRKNYNKHKKEPVDTVEFVAYSNLSTVPVPYSYRASRVSSTYMVKVPVRYKDRIIAGSSHNYLQQTQEEYTEEIRREYPDDIRVSHIGNEWRKEEANRNNLVAVNWYYSVAYYMTDMTTDYSVTIAIPRYESFVKHIREEYREQILYMPPCRTNNEPENGLVTYMDMDKCLHTMELVKEGIHDTYRDIFQELYMCAKVASNAGILLIYSSDATYPVVEN